VLLIPLVLIPDTYISTASSLFLTYYFFLAGSVVVGYVTYASNKKKGGDI